MVKRKKIKVQKLMLSQSQLQNARKKADEEFKQLIVWSDEGLIQKKPAVTKKVQA